MTVLFTFMEKSSYAICWGETTWIWIHNAVGEFLEVVVVLLKWVKTLGVVGIEWMNFAARVWILGGQGQNAMNLIVSPVRLYMKSYTPMSGILFWQNCCLYKKGKRDQRSLCMLTYWGKALLANREKVDIGVSGKITWPHWYPGLGIPASRNVRK